MLPGAGRSPVRSPATPAVEPRPRSRGNRARDAGGHARRTRGAPAPDQSPAYSVPGALSPYAGALQPSQAGDIAHFADAPRYDLWLDVDPRAARVAGVQQVRYTNRESAPLREIVFRLYPNTPYMGGAMTVTQVTVDGQDVALLPLARATAGVTGTITDTSVLSAALPSPLPPGQARTIVLTYELPFP